MRLQPDLKEFIGLLNSGSVERERRPSIDTSVDAARRARAPRQCSVGRNQLVACRREFVSMPLFCFL
jgi:hypothetical protein